MRAVCLKRTVRSTRLQNFRCEVRPGGSRQADRRRPSAHRACVAARRLRAT